MIVDCALYQDGVRQGGRLDVADLPPVGEDKDRFVWIGLYDPTPQEFEQVRSKLSLHDLAVEDALEAHQRPKLERYDESVFIVLTTARYDDERETVDFGEIQLFVGDGFVVHVRHGEAAPLTAVRRQLECHPELLACGPSSVLHAIIDRVVDDYEPVATGLENDIHEVELDVFSEKGGNPVQRIYFLKREVVSTSTALGPLLQPLRTLSSESVDFVHESMQHYFRDVLDHLVRLVEQVATFNDLLNSVLEANLTRVSVQQNEDMRKISAWVAIAAVPTMIAGIYGMNFPDLPALDSPAGWPLVVGFMVAACSYLYVRFRRSGWL